MPDHEYPVGIRRNSEGCLIETLSPDRFMAFEPVSGSLRAEWGLTLETILPHVVPRGSKGTNANVWRCPIA